MPKYLISGVDQTGNKMTKVIEANSGREAVAMMTSEGYAEITLHTDDASAAVLSSWKSEKSKKTSPADILKIRNMSQRQFLFYRVYRLYKRGWLSILIAFLILSYQCFVTHVLGVIGIIAIFVLLLPVLFVFVTAFAGPSQKFRRMIDAYAWGRWQEVLDLIPTLRGKVPEFELDARRAVALAGLGRLDEGLALIARHVNSAETPRWVYLARLAEVFSVAKQYDQSLTCHRMAYECDPENPLVQLGLAIALLKDEIDTPEARQLIEKAEQQTLSDMELMLFPYFKGLLALNENRFQQAEPLFLKAINKLQPLVPASPYFGLIVDLNRAYLAIAYARMGEKEKAERQFQLALPRLNALKSTRIIERYGRIMPESKSLSS